MTEFETTINNGLPVLVRGTVNECGPHEYPGRELHRRHGTTLDERESRAILDLTPEDDRRLSDELFEAAHEPPCDY